ncbi:MAG: hypothetical protein FJ102_27410 [Deltaproteobacteria bacterium]|nr:hypothetical protein [Deltaproteobacteria bacterium]
MTDRRVFREIDTPPNRLALRLAHEVHNLADDVLAALETVQPADQRYSVTMTETWRERARNYRDTAARVLAFPDFADVDAHGELALESPSVQLNARCRPLVNAWVRIHEGITIDADLERALHDPIANAPQLWEHWCFAQVVLALQALGWDGNIEIVAPLKGPQPSPTSDWFGAAEPGPRKVRMTHPAGAKAIWLWWASGGLPGNEDRVGGKWELPVQAYSDERFVPDILLLREAEPIVPESLHLLAVLDAKFSRSLSRANADEPSPWMQAHAYRDALRGKNQADPRPPWSILLYLGDRTDGADQLRRAPGSENGAGTGIGSLALGLGTESAQRALVRLLTQDLLSPTESAGRKSA